MKYYTLNPTTRDLVRLVPPIDCGGRAILHPTAEQFAQYGAYPRNDDAPMPIPPEGKVAVPDSWEVQDCKWVRTWRWEDAPPPPPRRWSRFAIKGALADAHLLPAAKQFFAAFEIKPDYSALEAFTDVDYIEEGYGGAEMWNALLDGAASALGKTRAEIDAFLDAIPTE